MKPVLDHIHITVKNLAAAEEFYDRLLPLVGYDLRNKETTVVPEHEYKVIEYHHALLSFGIVSARSAYAGESVCRRKPGAVHHIAFHAGTRREIDESYSRVREIGAEIIAEPRLYPEYCPDYYAFFFKDTEGIEYEIVCFDRPKYFSD